MKKPQYIFIHHTAVSWEKNPKQWPATNAYHKSKGWGGGGYNYEIAADGSVHQFRADGAVTAAQYQQNMNDGRAISICLDGNFDIEDPTPEQMKRVKEMILEKMKLYGIPKEHVYPHRRVAAKTCPGDRIPNDVYTYFCEEQKKEISDWAKEAAEKAAKKGIISNWNNPQEVLTNEKLKIVLFKLGLVKEPEGQVTLEQFAVALDRAGLLN